jgi:hypothetical protein
MAMTAREQEALSRRYAFGCIVTPLSDGAFAVFAMDRTAESMVIVDSEEELALACTSRANMVERKTPSKAPPVPINTGALFAEDDDEDA